MAKGVGVLAVVAALFMVGCQGDTGPVTTTVTTEATCDPALPSGYEASCSDEEREQALVDETGCTPNLPPWYPELCAVIQERLDEERAEELR